MEQSKAGDWEARALDWLGRNWKLVTFLVWLGFSIWFIADKWQQIRWFGLGDTDDNMRIMQVRAWMHGQGWYDLRNYRLNPPFGANIHWSRLVDLPIAGLIFGLRPFLGGAGAERWAVAIAPLLPYLVLLFALALTARRLLGHTAYLIAFLALFFAGSTNGMFMPERIDHHGWQLALLAISIAGIADPKKVRGGFTLGLSSALSLAIGLEMIIYLALAGVAMVLFWVDDREERARLLAYAVSLSGATALGFLVFASNDNWGAVCDALSPVWLSDALVGGALMFGLAWLSPLDWKRRLLLAIGAGAAIAGWHALMFPHCLQRLEGVSPEVEQLWLSHVKEARPIYRHGWRIATLILALPITGLIGWGLTIWMRRSDRELLRRVIGAAVPGLAATALLLWQTRTGPASQMMAVVGAAAFAWFLLPRAWHSSSPITRVLGGALVVICAAGAIVPMVVGYIPEAKASARDKAIGKANRLCGSMWGLRPIALQPKGRVFTFIDLSPRLITVTHHDAVAGPYHRNGQQIADVMNFWRGPEAQAHRIVQKYRSDYVLSCPNSSTTTIFAAEAPKGFYVQLQQGKLPAWLKPVPLPKDSPFRMWRVVG
ncbi:AcrB/AcrD/AcrF family protein [Sphingomonas flavescens]|uniref:AcrB/AcrD/AcrF family protein n=1 Tax=Sphingomonas flavescens TaxID=3132797 RepID=UPI00280572B9|nr:AcrB/AcrD/AcrF family protein [Sphingomonas limnosediminicola]